MCIINTIILIAMGVYIVSLKDENDKRFSDLIEVMSLIIVTEDEPNPKKTWDQKFEEELSRKKIIRED